MIDLLLVPVPKTLLSWAQDRPCAGLVLSVCSNTAILSCRLLSGVMEVAEGRMTNVSPAAAASLHCTSPAQAPRYHQDNRSDTTATTDNNIDSGYSLINQIA